MQRVQRHVKSSPHALHSLRPWRNFKGPRVSQPENLKGLFVTVTLQTGKSAIS